MKSRKTILIIASVIVVLGLIWYFFLRTKEQPVVLSQEKPTIGPISSSVTATGTVQPVDTVIVGTQVSGTISALYADFNSTVKKGQLLAQLDKTLIQTTVDQARASVAQAQSNQAYQQANFNRQKQLFETGSISRADYDQALNNLQVATASVNNARAQLRSAERNLSFTQIYSPIDGVVLGRSVSIGQTVAASFNTPTIFSIAKDITKMQVQAKVDEADIGNVAKGQRATFTVDAFIDDTFNGTVKDIRLQPSISSNVVTYATLIDAPNDNKKLKPGMTANIIIYTKEVNDALLISAQALKFRPDSASLKNYEIVPLPHKKRGDKMGSNKPRRDKTAGKANGETVMTEPSYVWVLDGQKLIQKRIKTGLNDNTHVEVLEGLTQNDIVINGMEGGVTAAPAAAATSPFMPQRRGGSRR
ncbi:HlyD family secretion protein [Pedobacter sp. AK017]|uniref:efflux RND transporter periplasmic adaptor subunit n=1 Tax=Pedobacter sp. AK017 TaxID=2723073 RepID=UPI00161E1F86|nr:efflux RND transporter periplasmic adaptor subunit [Pedobacter sp. AK017]MBB5439542.1 HlyD family secretion protein [Pedobacter sp. AK017]